MNQLWLKNLVDIPANVEVEDGKNQIYFLNDEYFSIQTMFDRYKVPEIDSTNGERYSLVGRLHQFGEMIKNGEIVDLKRDELQEYFLPNIVKEEE